MLKAFGAPLRLIKDTVSFLRTGVAPSGATKENAEHLKQINHLSSKKFFIVGTSFVALCFFYFISVAILFFLPAQAELIGGYVTIFTKTIEILAIIIASYLGVQAAVDLKYGSNSNVNYESPTTKLEKEIEESSQKFQNVFIDDRSYAPMQWVMSYEDKGEQAR